MKKMFPKLFEPGTIGTLRVKNRVVKAPQTTGLSNRDGTVTQRLVDHYTHLADGGCGLVIVEYAYVDDIASKSCHCQIGISTHEHIAGLGWLADSIKNHGAKAGIQIEHCGRQRFLGPPMKSASSIPWPMLYDQFHTIPEEMTIAEIQTVIENFGDAAKRAADAGFDLVEIHAAHGYLLTNFLSPFTNKRGDWYGGSRENRFRILRQIVENCRSKVGPDFPLTVRLSGTDYEPEGMTIEDTIYYAKELEKLGIDALHISGGDHHTMIHQVSPMAMPVCYNTWAAAAVKKEVNIPVMASGSITLPKYAEDILESGKADYVTLGRPLWADNEWVKKAMEDRPEDIRPCIRCNEGCLQRSSFMGRTVMCAVNPILGFENDLAIKPAEKKKKVVIAGGGPAGMEAARVLKLKGHDVTIYEKRKLGGFLHEASAPDFKTDIRALIDYQVTQIKKLGIPVVYEELTPEMVKAGGYDVVISAVGAEPIIPRVPGIDGKNVINALTILDNPPKIGKDVIVVGGGMIGTETAIDLAEKGHNVSIVEMKDSVMADCAITDKIAYFGKIAQDHVGVHAGMRVSDITPEGVLCVNDRTGKRESLKADSVVIAVGLRPRHAFYDALAGEPDLEVYEIGDCIRAGKILDAFHTAYKTAVRI